MSHDGRGTCAVEWCGKPAEEYCEVCKKWYCKEHIESAERIEK